MRALIGTFVFDSAESLVYLGSENCEGNRRRYQLKATSQVTSRGFESQWAWFEPSFRTSNRKPNRDAEASTLASFDLKHTRGCTQLVWRPDLSRVKSAYLSGPGQSIGPESGQIEQADARSNSDDPISSHESHRPSIIHIRPASPRHLPLQQSVPHQRVIYVSQRFDLDLI